MTLEASSVDYGENRSPSSGCASSDNPTILQISDNQLATPLFCFHDGSGQGSVYVRIGDVGRTVYAFSDPDFATDNLRPVTLGQMASRYAATISKSDTPSVILGGKSFQQLALSRMLRVVIHIVSRNHF